MSPRAVGSAEIAQFDGGEQRVRHSLESVRQVCRRSGLAVGIGRSRDATQFESFQAQDDCDGIECRVEEFAEFEAQAQFDDVIGFHRTSHGFARFAHFGSTQTGM